ncbi:MAG TPA: hypothetical protein PKC18_06335, partial [Lacipirellulaceae bacterium]|nr:hypothetical protein [Lacipirellulaceae bacterium]
NWVPDQDQPSLAMIALQRMIMQQTRDHLILLGAWPERWNVYFRLHADQRTVVTGEARSGKVSIDVNPVGPSSKRPLLVGGGR